MERESWRRRAAAAAHRRAAWPPSVRTRRFNPSRRSAQNTARQASRWGWKATLLSADNCNLQFAPTVTQGLTPVSCVHRQPGRRVLACQASNCVNCTCMTRARTVPPAVSCRSRQARHRRCVGQTHPVGSRAAAGSGAIRGWAAWQAHVRASMRTSVHPRVTPATHTPFSRRRRRRTQRPAAAAAPRSRASCTLGMAPSLGASTSIL